MGNERNKMARLLIKETICALDCATGSSLLWCGGMVVISVDSDVAALLELAT